MKSFGGKYALPALFGLTLIMMVGLMTHLQAQVIDPQKLSDQYFQEDHQWYINNIPFFECSDEKIQDVFYYRWKLYKAHIRNIDDDRYVITEFLDNVSWDKDPYSSLNDATAFHIYEGRWLKDNRYMNGYIDYMYRGGGNDRHFSEGIADAAYARYLVNGDSLFVIDQLSVMQHIYNLWLDHFDLNKSLYFIEPLLDATEYTISSIDATDGKDGFTGGHAFRPTINSFMYGNALAIANIAKLSGDTALCHIFLKKASDLKVATQSSLWNVDLHHFTDRYQVNNQYVHYWDFIRGRELAGFVPWCYNLPDNKEIFNVAWSHMMDSTMFLGKFGIRTVEPSYQYYMKQFRYEGPKPECQWNGPSWPFQTTQVLFAMANLLNNYTQHLVSASDYLKVLRLYTQQHYLLNGSFNLQEDYNPDTGKPIVGLSRSNHYNHSGYNDLIITGLCGIRPSDGNILIIHPLVDNTISYFCLQDLLYHGHHLTIVFDRDGNRYKQGRGLTVIEDGHKVDVTEKQGNYTVFIHPPTIEKTQHVKNLALNIWRKGYPIPSASVNSIADSLFQAIDGRFWPFPQNINRWTTFGSSSPHDWYGLDFGNARTVSMVKLFFYADSLRYEVPESFTVEYLKGSLWVPVTIKSVIPKNITKNTFNHVVFEKIVTNQMRVKFDHEPKNKFIALGEIEIY